MLASTKTDRSLMKIGELSALSGLSIDTIRFYEKQGLIPPPRRTDTNYRMYDADSPRRLIFIRKARDLGFTLQEIGQLLALSEDGHAGAGDVKERAKAKLSDVGRARQIGREKDQVPRPQVLVLYPSGLLELLVGHARDLVAAEAHHLIGIARAVETGGRLSTRPHVRDPQERFGHGQHLLGRLMRSAGVDGAARRAVSIALGKLSPLLRRGGQTESGCQQQPAQRTPSHR